MEKQLSFKLVSCSSGKVKSQRRTEKSKLSEALTKRPKKLNNKKQTSKLSQKNQQKRQFVSVKKFFKEKQSSPVKQFLQKQQEPAIQQQRQFEQIISELLTSSEKKLKLKSLFLEKEAQEKSETSFLNDTSLKTETPKEDLLFDNSIHLVSVKTVAELLGLAPKTIHNWVSLRKVPYVKCGQKVMFCPKSLKAWLNRKEIKSWL